MRAAATLPKKMMISVSSMMMMTMTTMMLVDFVTAAQSSGVATTTRYWDCSGGACGCAYLPSHLDHNSGGPIPSHCYSNGLFVAPSNNVHGAKFYGTAAISESLGGGYWLSSGCGKCWKVTGTSNIHGYNDSGVTTTIILKGTNFCPPSNVACSNGKVHFDIAAPGFDYLGNSLSNTCTQVEPNEVAGFTSCSNWMISNNNPNDITTCDCTKFINPTLRNGCFNFKSLYWNNPIVEYEELSECPIELATLPCWEENNQNYPFSPPDLCMKSNDKDNDGINLNQNNNPPTDGGDNGGGGGSDSSPDNNNNSSGGGSGSGSGTGGSDNGGGTGGGSGTGGNANVGDGGNDNGGGADWQNGGGGSGSGGRGGNTGGGNGNDNNNFEESPPLSDNSLATSPGGGGTTGVIGGGTTMIVTAKLHDGMNEGLYNSCGLSVNNNDIVDLFGIGGNTRFPYGMAAAIGGDVDKYSNNNDNDDDTSILDFERGYGCGSCYEVTCVADAGVGGNADGCTCSTTTPSVIVQVIEQCWECDSISSAATRSTNAGASIALNKNAMSQITESESSSSSSSSSSTNSASCSALETSIRRVNCDYYYSGTSGSTNSQNIILRTKEGVSEYWYGLYIFNVAGYGSIRSIELRSSGEEEFDVLCEKTDGPSYYRCQIPNPTSFIAPLDVRVTDTYGRSLIGLNVITDITEDTNYDFGTNFEPFHQEEGEEEEIAGEGGIQSTSTSKQQQLKQNSSSSPSSVEHSLLWIVLSQACAVAIAVTFSS